MFKKLLVIGACLGMLPLAGCGFEGGPLIKDDTFADHKIRFGGVLEDNKSLSIKVHEALKQHPPTMHSQIKVATFKEGSIKLSGNVNSELESREAERIAYSVDGVKSVANAIFIQ